MLNLDAFHSNHCLLSSIKVSLSAQLMVMQQHQFPDADDCRKKGGMNSGGVRASVRLGLPSSVVMAA